MSISQADVDALLAAAEDMAVEVGSDSGSAEPEAPASPTPSHKPQPASPPPRPTRRPPADLNRILRLSVPVIVKLAEQDMPVARVIEITAGSIIEFDRAFDAELDLIVSNRRIGTGQAVKVGENFGLRITQVGNLDEKIRALGG